MNNRPIIEAISPAELIKEELEARGWRQEDLAEILGRTSTDVSNLVNGKRAINAELAKELGEAFGTGAEFWLNLEGLYQLSKIKTDNTISRRAHLFEMFPVKEMIKRHWIESSDNIDVLEKRFRDFFCGGSLDDTLSFSHVAKKSTPYSETTNAQKAWICRVRHLAASYAVGKFSEKSFAECVDRLRLLLLSPEEIRQVPRVLSECGIRFVVVEHLPQTKLDGVCFWLDRSSPVIGLSLRIDRIDSFWFCLMHELGHVKNKDGQSTPVIDSDLAGDDAVDPKSKPEIEQKADRFAAESLIKKSELDNFIARVRPFYAKVKIQAFAHRLKIHPGIAVGQLHHCGEIHWSRNRDSLVKVRHIITSTAIVDGWGHTPVIKNTSRSQ
jgi:HTH-type transcriptional regulator / antitoxin HigA